MASVIERQKAFVVNSVRRIEVPIEDFLEFTEELVIRKSQIEDTALIRTVIQFLLDPRQT
jgi:hypothetical protein